MQLLMFEQIKWQQNAEPTTAKVISATVIATATMLNANNALCVENKPKVATV